MTLQLNQRKTKPWRFLNLLKIKWDVSRRIDIFWLSLVVLAAWHLRKEKCSHLFPEDQFGRTGGVSVWHVDMLNVWEKWQTIFTRCSERPPLSPSDIFPSHLIDKHYSGAYTAILLPDRSPWVVTRHPAASEAGLLWRGWFIRLIQMWWSQW